MTIKRSIRFAAVVMFMAVAFPGALHAGTPKEEPKESIEMFSIVNSPTACIGTEHLTVRILITNSGDVPVDLNIGSLSTTAGFLALIDTTEMKLRHQTFSSIYDPIGHVPQPSVNTLLPGSFFEKDIEIPIRDGFFSQAGFYKLNLSSSVRINQASNARDLYSSSSAIFELRACGSPQ